MFTNSDDESCLKGGELSCNFLKSNANRNPSAAGRDHVLAPYIHFRLAAFAGSLLVTLWQIPRDMTPEGTVRGRVSARGLTAPRGIRYPSDAEYHIHWRQSGNNENVHLSIKFGLSFGIIVVFCLLQGWLGYDSPQEANHHVVELADVRIPSLEGLILMVDNLREVMEIQRTLIIRSLSADQTRAMHGEIDSARAAYKRGVDIYEHLPQIPEGTRLWKEFLEMLTEGKTFNNQFFTLEKECRQGLSEEVHERMVQLTLGLSPATTRT